MSNKIPIIAPMTHESLDMARRLLGMTRMSTHYYKCNHRAYLDMSDIKPAHYVCKCNREEYHEGPHAMCDSATGELKAIWPNEKEAPNA